MRVDRPYQRIVERSLNHLGDGGCGQPWPRNAGAMAYPISTTESGEGAPLNPPNPTSTRASGSTKNSAPHRCPRGCISYASRRTGNASGNPDHSSATEAPSNAPSSFASVAAAARSASVASTSRSRGWIAIGSRGAVPISAQRTRFHARAGRQGAAKHGAGIPPGGEHGARIERNGTKHARRTIATFCHSLGERLRNEPYSWCVHITPQCTPRCIARHIKRRAP